MTESDFLSSGQGFAANAFLVVRDEMAEYEVPRPSAYE